MVNKGFSSQRKEIIYLGVFLFYIFSFSGCATVNVPYVGKTGYSLEEDEKRLHKRVEELSEIIDNSGHIYENKSLENYLTDLANQLLPEEAKKENLKIEVKVLKDPTLNAFALPNGRIYVHTGMLAVIENESQLAALLGHEMTHVLHRHTLQQFRSALNKSAFFSAVQMPIALVAGNLGVIFAELATVSSVYGFSRELEYDADVEGFHMMSAQGYDVNEAPKLFEHLKQFIEDEEIKQPFFFSTHPNVVARIENYKNLIEREGLPDQLKKDPLLYEQWRWPLIIENTALCLNAGMFKTAERLLNQYIEKRPNNADGYFYSGELYRERQDHPKKEKEREKNNDYLKALEAYSQAAVRDPVYAPSFKAKGRVLQKLGRIEEAKEAFQKYLSLEPMAKDRPYIEQFLSAK